MHLFGPYPDALLLPLAFKVSDAHSTSSTCQCIVWKFGCSTNQPTASSMPQAVCKNDEDPQAQEQHMHQWLCAPGVKMTCHRMRLGLFRTWGKTQEVGDLLGESCISFKTLLLLTIHTITSTDQEHCFPQSWHHHPPIIYALTNVCQTSPATPFHQTKHSPSHIGVVHQAAQNKQCSAISHLLWMPSTSPVEKGFHVGILRPVGCSRVQCPCGGEIYIILSISTLSYIHE